MTAAQLRAWIESRNLSHDEAAELLALSKSSLRGNLYGRRNISAQTAKLVELYERNEELQDLAERRGTAGGWI